MPLDILVPFWGDPAMLRETVRSVLDQTVGDWRLTVVDDAYPDPAVGAYLATVDDPRVVYVRNEENLGITGNFRRCVSLATEERVVLLGCDDKLLPTYVETVLAAHARWPEATMIQPGVEVIDETGAVVSPLADTIKQRFAMPRGSGPRLLGGEPLAASLMRANWLYWPSIAFRRDALSSVEFRDGYPVIQDLALEIDLICAGATILLEPTTCFAYRRHSASASSATALDGSRFDGERRYFAEAAAQLEALGWKRAARAARTHLTSRAHAVTLLPRALRTRDAAGARVLVRHAVGS